jgi:hypothetical protein
VKKTPAGGPAGVLVREQPGAPVAGSQKRARQCHDLDPGAILKLYKVARSEMTVDKSNNSTSKLCRGQGQPSTPFPGPEKPFGPTADGTDVGKRRVQAEVNFLPWTIIVGAFEVAGFHVQHFDQFFADAPHIFHPVAGIGDLAADQFYCVRGICYRDNVSDPIRRVAVTARPN